MRTRHYLMTGRTIQGPCINSPPMNAGLLAEFPALFQSFEETLTELTQKEYWAGGSNIMTILDYDTRELIVTGRWPGVSNPAALFTAGESGWSARVKDSPGLGFFALVEMAHEVIITSHTRERSWTATVAETCFDGAPIERVAIPVACV